MFVSLMIHFVHNSTDAFLLSTNDLKNQTLYLYTFDAANFEYKKHESATIEALGDVRSVAPADFNRDGNLDLLVTVATGASRQLIVYIRTADNEKVSFGL